eukprot:1145222-Pelagomonas_calceolata.AAC.4
MMLLATVVSEWRMEHAPFKKRNDVNRQWRCKVRVVVQMRMEQEYVGMEKCGLLSNVNTIPWSLLFFTRAVCTAFSCQFQPPKA